MKEFDWISDEKKEEEKKPDELPQKKPEDEDETKVIEPPKEEETTVIEHKGEPFDPFKTFAILALVGIAPEANRRVPQFSHIKRPVTVIGTRRGKAHIKADDLKTVKPEHGAIVFKDGRFFIYPQEGSVWMDGKKVSKEGSVLKNGSQIEIGSAKFIFLTTLKD